MYFKKRLILLFVALLIYCNGTPPPPDLTKATQKEINEIIIHNSLKCKIFIEDKENSSEKINIPFGGSEKKIVKVPYCKYINISYIINNNIFSFSLKPEENTEMKVSFSIDSIEILSGDLEFSLDKTLKKEFKIELPDMTIFLDKNINAGSPIKIKSIKCNTKSDFNENYYYINYFRSINENNLTFKIKHVSVIERFFKGSKNILEKKEIKNEDSSNNSSISSVFTKDIVEKYTNDSQKPSIRYESEDKCQKEYDNKGGTKKFKAKDYAELNQKYKIDPNKQKAIKVTINGKTEFYVIEVERPEVKKRREEIYKNMIRPSEEDWKKIEHLVREGKLSEVDKHFKEVYNPEKNENITKKETLEKLQKECLPNEVKGKDEICIPCDEEKNTIKNGKCEEKQAKLCQFILLKNGKKIFGKYKVQGDYVNTSQGKIPIADVEDLKAKGRCN